MPYRSDEKLPVVVLISGRGSNLQAIIDAVESDELPIQLCAVISNRPDAFGLERAKKAGIDAIGLDHKKYPDRESFDRAMLEVIDRYHPGLVVLAGYMRILTPAFVEHYQGKLLNIHPSLLPLYPGLNTHARVLENGETRHGASVHFVTTELDGGPVVLQVGIPVHPDDTAETLALRVLEQEHKIYNHVIQWFAKGLLKLEDNEIYLNQTKLVQPCLMNADTGEIENCPV